MIDSSWRVASLTALEIICRAWLIHVGGSSVWVIVATANKTRFSLVCFSAPVFNFCGFDSNPKWNIWDCSINPCFNSKHKVLQSDYEQYLNNAACGNFNNVRFTWIEEGISGHMRWMSPDWPIRAQLTMTPATPIISIAFCQAPIVFTRLPNGRWTALQSLNVNFTRWIGMKMIVP